MQQPHQFYTDRLALYQKQSKRLHQQLRTLSLFRLLVFLGGAAAIYFTWGTWVISLGTAIVAGGLFLVLLNKYTRIKSDYQVKNALMALNQKELDIADGHVHQEPDGTVFQQAEHPYSADIDLFGKGSFYQYLNRTAIYEGSQTLADLLQANDILDITSKQAAIKELSSLADWRQLYTATASLAQLETPSAQLVKWLNTHKTFLPFFIKWFPYLFMILSIGVVAAAASGWLSWGIIGYWLIVGLAITGYYLKKINHLALQTDKLKENFRQYSLLLNQIEQQQFSSSLLTEKQEQLKSEEKKAAVIFRELSRAMDSLDNRNNLIAAVFGNGFLLLDLRNAFKVEQWIKSYGHKVEDWLEVIYFFDAYNSLGTYAFNHPAHVFPTLTQGSTVIEAKDLGHPLLKASKRIDNDLVIKHKEFFIVTGANMAGKSTFLRTVSLHIVMANIGLPVCATYSLYSPIKLITSMRTSDSLTDDSSYFFSELTRLKYIVDAIQEQEYFIILDEILKGTNSTDKAIGSRKFVEKLVGSGATGIIATHDLSLCTIEQELPSVHNYYFDAEIVNDELYFDYTFKSGICQNMNASFLLKKMQII